MRNRNDVANAHMMEFARNFPGDDKKKPGSENKMLWELFISLMFLGAEAVFAIFRKNSGRDIFKLMRLALAFLVFVLIAYLLFDSFQNGNTERDGYGSPESYIITSMILLLLALRF